MDMKFCFVWYEHESEKANEEIVLGFTVKLEYNIWHVKKYSRLGMGDKGRSRQDKLD